MQKKEALSKSTKWASVAITLLAAALSIPAQAEVVYTPVNVVIPSNGSYNIDLNRDGTTDFTLSERLLQVYCQFGDRDRWYAQCSPAKAMGASLRSARIRSH